MSYDHLSFSNVTFNYESSHTPVLGELSLDLHRGWTGITGANGAGKTTFLLLACGLLEPSHGTVFRPDRVQYISQRTDYPPEEFTEFLYDPDGSVQRLIGILGIGFDWPYRWDTLSQGERKRAQVGTALWKQPDLLALDEPTNHLDYQAKNVVFQALHEYGGIGLMVSHDRGILDSLCSQCLFFREESWRLRPGGITRGLEEEERERLEAARKLEKAKKEVKALLSEADSRRHLAEGQQKRRSKRGLAIKDHDARFKRNKARITGKDGTGGKLLRQMDGRIKQAGENKNALTVPKNRHTGISVTLGESGSDFLFVIKDIILSLDSKRKIVIPELFLKPEERIALKGPNGCGKTTVIREIINHLPLRQEEYLYLPQELTERESEEITRELEAMNNRQRGELLAQVSRLGSNPERLLCTELPSPGESRKLILAKGFLRQPKLIILDEPTNHMDLPSIQCLETCLSDLSCGMIMVSHDEAFINRMRPEILEFQREDFGNTGAENFKLVRT